MKVHQIDHKGKTVFVGIDVHKKTYAVCAKAEHIYGSVKFSNLPAVPKMLAEKLKKSFPGARIKTAYEAGFSGFALHRVLVEEGIENIVVNPASIEVAANDKTKTDKIDAEKISTHLSYGRLKAIRVPSLQEELDRQYSRTRRQLVEHRTSLGNQIKSKLFQFGHLNHEDDRVMSLKRVEEFEALDLPEELAFVVQTLGSLYKTVSSQIKSLEQKMSVQAAANEEVEKVYLSVPGIGPISARILASEVGNLKHFTSQKALYKFTGMTPSEDSSGPNERKGHITRQGHTELRAILVEASWRAIKKDLVLAQIYNRIKATRGGKRAIVAVARVLIGRIRGCFQSGTLYELGFGLKQEDDCRAEDTSQINAHKSVRLPTSTAGQEIASC
jgi:transposase